MIKKISKGILIALVAVFLVACGDSGDTGASDGEDLNIGFSISFRDQFLTSLETAMIDSAPDNVNLTVNDAQQDISDQLQHVQNAVTQGYDAMIVNLVNTDNAEEIVNAAGDMPVVFVNRIPSADVVNGETVFYVGSDENDSGGLQGEFLTEYFNEKGVDEINYVMLMGTLGLQHTTLRTNSVIETLEGNGFTTNAVYEDTADFDRAEALEKMQQFLGSGAEYDVVIANNDEMALGAIEAMRSSGEDVENIPVVGIDATTEGMASVADGELNATVFQDAAGQGETALEIAIMAANGEENMEEIYWVPFELVTPDNLSEFQ